MSHEARFAALGLTLPPAPKPIGAYKPMVVVGSMGYLSGHGPLHPDGTLTKGCVGTDHDPQAGYEAAKQTGLALLATMRKELGSLDRIERIIKLFGMVNCVPGFDQQPAVINGCSDLFRDVFGEDHGIGARSAIGVPALPANMSVEIEALVSIKHDM